MSIKKYNILRIIIVIVLIASGIFIYKNRRLIHRRLVHYHLYHELKYIFFADKYAKGNVNMKYYYDKEAQGKSVDLNLPVEWWFRPSHIGTFCATGLVDDVDNDGKPEVYVYGGSKYIYCLDGKTGDLIWKFHLPFGRVGALAAILEDVNDDGAKELIVGSHTDLPLRVYCLSTKKNIAKRIIWFTNVHGDFIQGGLVSFRDRQGRVRIIAATRDAPYSRGTINVLNKDGKHLYPPIYGVDVCNHRPSIADINNDGYLDMVIGSHNFYGAKYGHKVTAFTVETGKLIWSTPVGFDTGPVQFPIIDINNDGKFEILAESKILNAEDGRILPDDITKDNELGVFSTIEFNDFPNGVAQFFLDLDLDGRADFLNAYLISSPVPQVQFYLFDALTGNLKNTIIKDLDQSALRVAQEYLPCQQELEDFANNGFTGYNKPGYKEKKIKIKKLNKINRLSFMLSDVDGDMEWEALVNFNAVLFCFDLPFAIPKKYLSFRYRRLTGDPLEDQSGFNYDLPKRAFN